MSILQTIHNKLDFFQVDINGVPITIDHIIQTSLYSGVGVIGEPGHIILTAQAFRLLDPTGMNFNPVGKEIHMMIQDPKSGDRPYGGVITSMTHQHHKKQTMVVLGFDKPHWVELKSKIWWKCFGGKTILEITKEFFEEHGVPFNQYPENHAKFRGTYWENFCVPAHGSALPYLLEELTKDNFIYFTNPEDGGIVVINWSDIQHLDKVAQNFPDYVQDQIMMKFDTRNTGWQKHTFTFGKQIDSELPWKIQEFHGNINPDLSTEFKKTHTFYTGAKYPFSFDETSGETVDPNDIGLREQEAYPGLKFLDFQVRPYPALENLINHEDHPLVDYGKPWDHVVQNIIHPRFMYYRMQQSYSDKIKLVNVSIVIPGSAKAVVPMTAVPVSYFENARVEDPESPVTGDFWQSGLFLIWSAKLSIVGQNMITTLELVKPYH